MKNEINGFGIAGFVLAIISLFFFPLVLGVISIILGMFNSESGIGKAAIVIGVLSIIWALILACAYRY